MKSNLITENYSLLSLHFLEKYDEELAKQHSKEYDNLLKMHEGIIPKGRIYLHGMLHDSWVTSIECTSQELCIWLNEFSTHCFSDAYAETYGIKIPHKKLIMPLRLRFVGLKCCQVYWIKNNLKMIPVSKEKYFPYFGEYLYDEMTFCENEFISMGILFWSNKEYPRERRYLLLKIESAHLDIEEHQTKAFVDLLGSDHIDLFNKYWDERHKDTYYFDYSTALSFLKGQIE